MKKICQKEVTCCDFCGAECYPHTCLHCGKEACWDCSKKQMITYPHSLYCDGSEDGDYCLSCDMHLIDSGADRLHIAYRKIKRLRMDSRELNQNIATVAKQIEADVQRFRRERKEAT